MSIKKASSKSFALYEQKKFAQISGDANPLHIDPAYARRTIQGKTVVHGIHLVFQALNYYLKRHHVAPAGLKISFIKPVLTGMSVSFSITTDADENHCLKISSGDSLCAKIEVSLNKQEQLPLHQILRYETVNQFPEAVNPRFCNSNEPFLRAGSIPLCAPIEPIEHLFPGLTSRLPIYDLAALLASTRIVGTIFPGLNSIYHTLTIHFKKQSLYSEPILYYDLKSYDKRFKLSQININAFNATGVIGAIFRPEPYKQNKFTHYLKLVSPNSFATTKTLVIGGSRGLGEVASKIICAGGSEVSFTYNIGYQDAQEISHQIKSAGYSSSALHYNLMQHQPCILPNVTHMVYMPTPRIILSESGTFNRELFQDYKKFYVDKFYSLASYMAKNTILRYIFYPSTIFLEDTRLSHSEYAQAKKLGEATCERIKSEFPKLSIYAPRLKPLMTDQHLSLGDKHKVESADTTLLESLKNFYSQNSS